MNRSTSRLIVTAIWVAFAIAVPLLPARPVLAQNGPTMEVYAGFDGYAGESGWIPLQVILSNDGPDLEVVVRVLYTRTPNGATISYERAVNLPTHSHKRVWLYVPAGLFSRNILVHLVTAKGTVLDVQAEFDTVRQQDYLVGVVSAEPSAFYLLSNLPLPSNGRMRIAALTPDDLPPDGRTWDVLEALVVHDPDWTQWGQAQRNALRNWVSVGGHLVITSGPAGLATAPQDVAELLPAMPDGGTETMDDLPTLAAFTATPLFASGPFVVARVASAEEKVVLREGDRPLLARHACGVGLVDVLALDPALEPLRNWPGTEVLWNRILNPTGGSQILSLLGTLNGDPISLYNLPNLGLPSVWQLILFLLVYITIIGPVNYLVLRRLKRRELAWFTIPALALFFSGLAYATGFRLRGGQVIAYETNVVHVRAGSDVAAVESFVGLFSPHRTTYQVSLPGTQLVDVARSNYASGSQNRQTISQGDPTLLPSVRVDVGAVRSFRATTYQPWTPLQTELVVGSSGTSSSTRSPRIQGRIYNASNVTFKDCALAWQGNIHALGDLAHGQSLSVNEALRSGPQFLPTWTPMPRSTATVVPVGTLPPGATPSPNPPTPLPMWTPTPASSTLSQPPAGGPSFAEAITGGNRYSSPQVGSRYSILTTLFGWDNRGWPPIWNDPYLICWAEEPVIQAQVEGHVVEHRQTTLLFIQLPYRLQGADDVYVPPEAVAHQVIDAQGNYVSFPGGYNLAEGRLELEFSLPDQARDLRVKELILYAPTQENRNTVSQVTFSLWNWQAEQWIAIDKTSDYVSLPTPAPFVDGEGNIRLQIETDGPLLVQGPGFAVVGTR